eukprot:TRINITY_DN12208_c0_g1_i1.p1 TRINITY_DN12208_c0_g1~~TRINITY_DN12208_c0_g1_i1.p1  ORF type:complete len:211 (-),score=59.86 TRINITY_DN12208_c0_g1_i1:61-603(-)
MIENGHIIFANEKKEYLVARTTLSFGHIVLDEIDPRIQVNSIISKNRASIRIEHRKIEDVEFSNQILYLHIGTRIQSRNFRASNSFKLNHYPVPFIFDKKTTIDEVKEIVKTNFSFVQEFTLKLLILNGKRFSLNPMKSNFFFQNSSRKTFVYVVELMDSLVDLSENNTNIDELMIGCDD